MSETTGSLRRTDIKEIFLDLCDLPPSQRAGLLEARCGDDAELRAIVQSLLEAHDLGEQSVSGPTVDNLPHRAGTAPSGIPHRQIGPYQILDELGEGGFAMVYLAEQRSPVRRRVALKILKLGLDSRQVIARFDAERQALAMMDHPGIAKVFDGGTTETGRPYFVMELVDGVPVTQYCDENKLNVAQRLELFVQVCGAVQHAHQKGVIHRDIKPSNVLVSTHDGQPLARVIDFGIAKATQTRLTDKTLHTEFQQLVGTPEYMSPEQADGSLDIDTRSDVYSLGVLLYELLAGAPPFDPKELRSKTFSEIQRIIREVDPPKPSTRLSATLDTLGGVAARRGTEAGQLTRLVRGELDWIVMRCLEKERARRYESASALAADVLRHLADEPVFAAKPSRVYRVRKFVRRNRVPVLASAVVVLVLIAGFIGTTIGLVGQARQRAEAQRQTAIAEAVSQFQAEMLNSADPGRMLGDKVTVFQVVMAAVKELDDGKLSDQPLVEASIRETIGKTLRALGRAESAEPNLRRALELRRNHLPPAHPSLSAVLGNLAMSLQAQGKFAEAEPMFRQALDMQRQTQPLNSPSLAVALNNLGLLLDHQARFEEAEPLYREALDIRRRALPPGDPATSRSLNNLAALLYAQGRFDEAEPMYHEALAMRRTSFPPGHPLIALSLNNLAMLLRAQGKLADAEPLLRENVEISRKVFPADHPDTAKALVNLGSVLQELRKRDEAKALFVEAIEINRKSLPAGHADVGTTIGHLASLLRDEGELLEAERLYREALDIHRKALAVAHPQIAADRISLAATLRLQSRFVDAEAELVEAERHLARAPSPSPRHQKACIQGFIELYAAWEKSQPGHGYGERADEWRAKLPKPTPVAAK